MFIFMLSFLRICAMSLRRSQWALLRLSSVRPLDIGIGYRYRCRWAQIWFETWNCLHRRAKRYRWLRLLTSIKWPLSTFIHLLMMISNVSQFLTRAASTIYCFFFLSMPYNQNKGEMFKQKSISVQSTERRASGFRLGLKRLSTLCYSIQTILSNGNMKPFFYAKTVKFSSFFFFLLFHLLSISLVVLM